MTNFGGNFRVTQLWRTICVILAVFILRFTAGWYYERSRLQAKKLLWPPQNSPKFTDHLLTMQNLEDVIDLDACPLGDENFITSCKKTFAEDGVLILPRFLRAKSI